MEIHQNALSGVRIERDEATMHTTLVEDVIKPALAKERAAC